jgi:endoglucanase
MKTSKLICFFLAVIFCYPAYGTEKQLWSLYKSRFLTDDGRIVDFSQDKISHSEGQGYGLLLAVANDDRAAFDKLYAWTNNNLHKRSDHLFAWKWGKRPNGNWGVIDYNNATDGDILIAFALLKAYEKWKDGNYKSEALGIIKDIRENLSIKWQGRVFLLPGYQGYFYSEGFALNPSYQIFTAFRRFAEEDDKDFWMKIYDDAMHLMEKSCFGSPCLPADWVYLTGNEILINPGKSPYFGYSAIRTILYLSEDRPLLYGKGLRGIFKIYEKLGYLPKWVDLKKEAFSMKPSYAGAYAIYALTAKQMGEKTLSEKISKEAREILNKEKENYYSFSLYLLATSTAIFKQ